MNNINVLGNAKANTNTGSTKLLPKIDLSRAKNTAYQTASNVKNTWDNLSGVQKILIGLALLVVIIFIYLVYRYLRQQREIYRFSNEPLFMTEIEENRPHNTKKVYRFFDKETNEMKSYIPGYYFNDKNSNNYTFSFWIFINGREWSYRFDDWKHIFHRGSKPVITEGVGNGSIADVKVQTPGFWLSPKENNLHCLLSTDRQMESIILRDVELSKWTAFTMVLRENNMTLYRNGRIERIINFNGTPLLTRDSVYINYFGGLAGNMAYLQYFSRALNPNEVYQNYQGFRGNIDKYVHHMFEKEVKRSDLMPLYPPGQPRCDFLMMEKAKREATENLQKVRNAYLMLCEATKDIPPSQCKKEVATITTKNMKEVARNLLASIRSLGDGRNYYYQSLTPGGAKKDRIAQLNQQEYEKIKFLL